MYDGGFMDCSKPQIATWLFHLTYVHIMFTTIVALKDCIHKYFRYLNIYNKTSLNLQLQQPWPEKFQTKKSSF